MKFHCDHWKASYLARNISVRYHRYHCAIVTQSSEIKVPAITAHDQRVSCKDRLHRQAVSKRDPLSVTRHCYFHYILLSRSKRIPFPVQTTHPPLVPGCVNKAKKYIFGHNRRRRITETLSNSKSTVPRYRKKDRKPIAFWKTAYEMHEKELLLWDIIERWCCRSR